MRRNRLLKRATRSEVEATVKLWLRYAYDRSGGRTARTLTSTCQLDNRGRATAQETDSESE